MTSSRRWKMTPESELELLRASLPCTVAELNYSENEWHARKPIPCPEFESVTVECSGPLCWFCGRVLEPNGKCCWHD